MVKIEEVDNVIEVDRVVESFQISIRSNTLSNSIARAIYLKRSVNKGNQFFHYTDINNKLNCKLNLSEILELIFFFVMDIPMTTAVILTGNSKNTITDRYNMCREVCEAIVYHERREKIVGTNDKPIQIDEARFADRRKYKQGSDCRYFCVERRGENSLISITERKCEKGSVIHSDEWPAYNNLNAIGYHHLTVNYQRHYVDPVTGAHTQAIE
uniref:ISXO2-like transposase domain-containing protein n=1 Tax=Octopus bimaculoides TaxID=37653 RepID=A0A0L8HA93_OCTBM